MLNSLAGKFASFLSSATRAEEARQVFDDGLSDSLTNENLQLSSDSNKEKSGLVEPSLNDKMDHFLESFLALNDSSAEHNDGRNMQITRATLNDFEALKFLQNVTEFFVVSNPKPSLEKDPDFLLDGSKYIFIEKETMSFNPENGTSSSPQTSVILRATSPEGFNIVRFVTQGKNLLEVEAKSRNSPADNREHDAALGSKGPSDETKRLVVQSVEVVTSRSQKIGPIDDFAETVQDVPKQHLDEAEMNGLVSTSTPINSDRGVEALTTDNSYDVTDQTVQDTTIDALANELSSVIQNTADSNTDMTSSTQPDIDSTTWETSQTSERGNVGNDLQTVENITGQNLNAPKSLDLGITQESKPTFSPITLAPSQTKLHDTTRNAVLNLHDLQFTDNTSPNFVNYKDSHALNFHSSELDPSDFFSQELNDGEGDHNSIDVIDEYPLLTPLSDSAEVTDDDDIDDYFRNKGRTISDLIRGHERERNKIPLHEDQRLLDSSRDRGKTSASVLLLLLTSLTRAMHDNGSNSVASDSSHRTQFPNDFKHFSEILSQTQSFLNASTEGISSFQNIPAVTSQLDSPIIPTSYDESPSSFLLNTPTVFDESTDSTQPIPKSLSSIPSTKVKEASILKENIFPLMNVSNSSGIKLPTNTPDPFLSESLTSDTFPPLLNPSGSLVSQLHNNISLTTPSLPVLPWTNFPALVTLNPTFQTTSDSQTTGDAFRFFSSERVDGETLTLPNHFNRLLSTPHPPDSEPLGNRSSFRNTLVETTTQMDDFSRSTFPNEDNSKTESFGAEDDIGLTTELNIEQLLPNLDSPGSLEPNAQLPNFFQSKTIAPGFIPATPLLTTTIPTPATTAHPLALLALKTTESLPETLVPRSRLKFYMPGSKFLTKSAVQYEKNTSLMTPKKITSGPKLSPEGTVLCRPSATPECALKDDDYCLQDPHYPRNEIIKALSSNARLASYFANSSLSGPRGSFSLVAGISRQRDLSFSYAYHNPGLYDVTHWLGPEGYACPSSVSYEAPLRAKNSRGQWRVVVQNVRNIHQRTRTEVCLHPGHPCRLVAERYGSRCVQKFALTQLLAMDPCDVTGRLFVDTFSFPSACSCFAHAYG